MIALILLKEKCQARFFMTLPLVIYPALHHYFSLNLSSSNFLSLNPKSYNRVIPQYLSLLFHFLFRFACDDAFVCNILLPYFAF